MIKTLSVLVVLPGQTVVSFSQFVYITVKFFSQLFSIRATGNFLSAECFDSPEWLIAPAG